METEETDAALLSRYVESRNEAAFTELVNRHIALVYSAACRETGGDASAAQDVTQLVFIELARKARGLTGSSGLAGWLYVSVRHVSANRRREQQRRAARERKAHMMNEPLLASAAEPSWEDLSPVLDDALHELNEQDRNAVVLRFLEENTLQKVGAALGLTENAARMRVDRALDKLRARLAKRGMTSTASGLAVALGAAVSVSLPPAALASSVAAGALASSSAGATSVLAGLSIQFKVGLVASVVVAGMAVPWAVRLMSRDTNGSGGAIPTAAVLSGAFLFSSDPAGNPSGNLAWDTRGLDSDYYKIWLSSGSPHGNPDGLTAAFHNGPSWAAAPLHLRLTEGTNRFTLFFQHDGGWPTMGLNLFFNSNLVAAITVTAPARTNDEIPEHSASRARRTFSLTSYPSPNVRASGATGTVVLGHPVALTEFYHIASTNFFELDRVSSHAASSNGRLDCVASFTLVVGPRRDAGQARALP